MLNTFTLQDCLQCWQAGSICPQYDYSVLVCDFLWHQQQPVFCCMCCRHMASTRIKMTSPQEKELYACQPLDVRLQTLPFTRLQSLHP